MDEKMAKINDHEYRSGKPVCFFLAGLCEIGGGYLVWLWLREDMSWILGGIGGFILFVYSIIPTFQSSHFHRTYAAYGGIFIVFSGEYG